MHKVKIAYATASLVVATLVSLACTSALPAARPLASTAPHTAALPADDTKVIATGDSITEYVVDPTHAWPMRLRDRICGEGCSVVTNKGHGGTCLAAVGCGAPGSRLVDTWKAEVLDQHPTTVIIADGTNDLWFPNTSVNQMADAYKMLVYSAIDAGIQPIVFTIDPICPNAGPAGYLNDRRKQINGWLLSYFGTGPGSVMVDTASTLQASNGWIDPAYHKNGCNGTDSMHLNKLGEVIQSDDVPLTKIH